MPVWNVVFIVKFFLLKKKKKRHSWNLCFLLTKIHFKKLPFLTKTLVEKFTARCTYPGYKQSSLSPPVLSVPFCCSPLCRVLWCVSLCHTLCCFWIRCGGAAEQKEAATSWRLVTAAGPEKALGWAEPDSILLTWWTPGGRFGFGKRKSLERVREKVRGIWASARVIVEVSCGSPVSVFSWLFPVVQE